MKTPQKLYLVGLEKKEITIVAADKCIQAEQEARLNVDEIFGRSDRDVSVFASEIKNLYDIPHDFLDGIPYNSNDDLTCREIFAEIKKKKKWDILDGMQLKFEFWDKTI